MARHRKINAKPPSARQLRVGEMLRHALAEIFLRGNLHDPDLEGQSITVTEITISPDLKQATAYVIPLAGVGQDRIMAALRRAASSIQVQLAKQIMLKFTPRLRFVSDNSFDNADHISHILNRPEIVRDLVSAEALGSENEKER